MATRVSLLLTGFNAVYCWPYRTATLHRFQRIWMKRCRCWMLKRRRGDSSPNKKTSLFSVSIMRSKKIRIFISADRLSYCDPPSLIILFFFSSCSSTSLVFSFFHYKIIMHRWCWKCQLNHRIINKKRRSGDH